MKNLNDVVKTAKAKRAIEVTADSGPGKRKTVENRKAMEAIETKAAKEKTDNGFEVHTTKPPKEVALVACPFCGEKRNIKGVNRHIRLKHNVPGVSTQDLDDVNKGLKSLEDLVCEKFNGNEEIIVTNLPNEIGKREFPFWEDPIKVEDPEEPVEKSEEEEASLDPDDKEEPEEELEERGASNLLPLVLIIGTATMILSRIEPFKEIADKLADKLAALGSKKSINIKKSFGQHAADLYKDRGN